MDTIIPVRKDYSFSAYLYFKCFDISPLKSSYSLNAWNFPFAQYYSVVTMFIRITPHCLNSVRTEVPFLGSLYDKMKPKVVPEMLESRGASEWIMTPGTGTRGRKIAEIWESVSWVHRTRSIELTLIKLDGSLTKYRKVFPADSVRLSSLSLYPSCSHNCVALLFRFRIYCIFRKFFLSFRTVRLVQIICVCTMSVAGPRFIYS